MLKDDPIPMSQRIVKLIMNICQNDQIACDAGKECCKEYSQAGAYTPPELYNSQGPVTNCPESGDKLYSGNL